MPDRLLKWQRTNLPSRPRNDYVGTDLAWPRLYARVYLSTSAVSERPWYWVLADDSGKARIIWDRLARRLDEDSVDSDDHPVELLIRLALPEVKHAVANWVDAIRFGESHNVRPFKLRGYLYIKGGLVQCAELFR